MKVPYKIFKIPKKSGGYRTIEAPQGELKNKQRMLLIKLYRSKTPASPFAYGFVKKKNIAMNAKQHEGKDYVARIDIKDFFPSITAKNLLRVINKAPVAKLIQEHINDLCYDFNDGKGLRLPQGAPTSPCLSNMYLAKLDWRLAWLSFSYGATYTRYADDLIFSANDLKVIKRLLVIAKNLLAQHGLSINNKKTKITTKGTRQLVTGLVVNCKAALPRKIRKNLRAAEHQARQRNGNLDSKWQGVKALNTMVKKAPCLSSNITICGTLKTIKQL